MSENRRWINLLPIVVALAIGIYFYNDPDTQLASHHLQVHEATKTSLIEVDKTGLVINSSDSFSDLTGYTRKELIGTPLTNLMVVKARTKHPKSYGESEPSVTIVRCEIIRKGGGIEPVLIIARIGGGRYMASIVPQSLLIDHYSKGYE